MTRAERADGKRLCESPLLDRAIADLEALLEDDPEPEDGVSETFVSFVRHARTAYPAALAEIDRLEAALRKIADPSTGMMTAARIAKEALGE